MKSKKSKKVVATKSYVRRALRKNLEVKYRSLEYSSTADTTGTFIDISVVSPGTAVDNRIGDRYKPVSMKFNFATQLADLTNRMRMIIFQWHPNDNIDIPQVSELLITTAGYETQAPINPNFKSQFTILRDQIITLDAAHVLRDYKFIVRPRRHVEFNNASNTGRNHIYLFLISDSAVATHPSYTVTILNSFTDA